MSIDESGIRRDEYLIAVKDTYLELKRNLNYNDEMNNEILQFFLIQMWLMKEEFE